MATFRRTSSTLLLQSMFTLSRALRRQQAAASHPCP